jgi:hypothetical protein
VRFGELGFSKGWKSLQEQRPELIGPHQVHDLLVGKHGIRQGTAIAQEHGEKNRNDAD